MLCAFICCFLSCAAYAASSKSTFPSWENVPDTIKSEMPTIESECKKLEFTPISVKTYVPDFPAAAFPKKLQGWAVFDFKINASGNTIIVGAVDQSDLIFKKQAAKALKKLSFTVSANWESTCASQVYRIGYAFRLMSECVGNEFPKPIIGVCTVGVMVEYR